MKLVSPLLTLALVTSVNFCDAETYEANWESLKSHPAEPDIVWFDSWLDRIPEDYRQRFAAYYFNKAEEWDCEVVIVRKQDDLPIEFTVNDHEKSREPKASPRVWMTDDTISTGSWCYTRDLAIKPTAKVVHALVDTVAKNGVVLLNISPMADGTIPEDQRQVLLELGDWMKINGEAIYATRPWKTFGEGPTVEPPGGFQDHRKFLNLEYSVADVRYTQSKDGSRVYAICLGWPGSKLTLNRVRVVDESSNASVRLLGRKGKLDYEVTGEGTLVINIPPRGKSEKSNQPAYSVRLTGFELDVIEE